MSWIVATANDIGTRAEQQDRVSVLRSRRTGGHLVVMADGMGGHADGAAAAQQVVDVAGMAFRNHAIDSPRTFLEEVCYEAHSRIRESARGNGRAPGSTCTLLYLQGEEAYWMHVGDSRLYHFAEGGLRSRTQDHTLTELMAADGADAGEDGAPASNQLYMCLGGENAVVPNFGASALGRDDWFMLCTDGFWSQVRLHEVARLMGVDGSLDEVAKQLVALARRRASENCDNITLALVRREAGRGWWPLRRSRSYRSG